MRGSLVLILIAALLTFASALYVPGELVDYQIGGPAIPLLANSIRSTVTQVPYEFYSLPICQPVPVIYESLNLGEILSGDRIVNTLLHVEVLEPDTIVSWCNRTMTTADKELLSERIRQNYYVEMILDNMPLVMYHPNETIEYTEGVPLGWVGDEEYGEAGVPYVFNHYRFIVRYHQPDDMPNVYRIVGLEVEPESVLFGTHPEDGELQPASADAIHWSYEVIWVSSPLLWRERWDPILALPTAVTDAHLKTFFISLLLVALLAVMVLFTLFRTIRDIRRYNRNAALRESDEGEGIAGEFDETGWKNCHDDVFRTPWQSGLLSVFTGVGIHLAAVVVLTTLLAAFGILSPASRGSLMSAFSFLFAFTGTFCGFVTSRLYRMFRDQTPFKLVIMSSVLWPGTVSFLGLILTFVMIGAQSSMALPFGTIMALLGLWIAFALGNLLGRFLARRGKSRAYPAQVGDLPRTVMPGPWYVQPRIAPFVGGILPFAVMFIAVHYAEAAMWTEHFYYLYGFTILTVLLTVLTAAATSIICVYFFLCWEVANWWWLAFFTPASSGLYVFIYLIYVVSAVIKPQLGAGVFMFLVHAVVVSGSVFLALGSIGLLTTLAYVWYMFSSIKID